MKIKDRITLTIHGKDPQVVEELIGKYSDLDDIDYIIRNSDIRALRENVILRAIEKGYEVPVEVIRKINITPSVRDKILETTEERNVYCLLAFQYAADPAFIEKAFDKGYHFRYNDESTVRMIIISILMEQRKGTHTLENVLSKINDIYDQMAIIRFLQEKDAYKLLGLMHKNNKDSIKYILRNINNVSNENIANFINSCNPDVLLDSEVMDLATSRFHYEITEDTPVPIRRTNEELREYIESCTNIYDIFNAINVSSTSILEDLNLLDLAVSKGYYFNKDTPEFLLNSKDALKRVLEKTSKEGMESTIAVCPQELLDLELMEIMKKNGYHITLSSPFEKIDALFESEQFPNVENEENEKYTAQRNKMSNWIGKGIFNYECMEPMNPIFHPEFLRVFDENFAMRIFKYYSLPDAKNYHPDVLRKIIEQGDIDLLESLYKHLIQEQENHKNIDLNQFFMMVDNYALYGQNIKRYLEKNNVTNESIHQVNKVLTTKLVVPIHSEEDIENYEELARKQYEKIVNSTQDRIVLQDTIFRYLANMTLEEYKDFKDLGITPKNLRELSKSLKNPELKELVKKYTILVDFLNYLETCKDIEKLRIISRKIMNSDSKNLDEIHSFMSSMVNNIKYIYGVDVDEKLTKISKETSSKNTVVDSTSYQVPYIETSDQAVYLSHTMNAYGSGGKLMDFINPRLVGRTYICLCLCDNNTSGVKREPVDVDHVTLVFNHIDPKSLVAMSSHDLMSVGLNNDLNIRFSRSTTFIPVNRMLKNTHKDESSHNEYVVYREDLNGNSVYPSGVLVTGEKPHENEVEAAKILGVPLIKVKKQSTLVHASKDERQSKEDQESIKALKRMLEEWKEESTTQKQK